MNEHIEKRAVIKMIDNFVNDNNNRGFPDVDIFDMEMLKKMINKIPIADVVSVVRCKDCINYETGKEHEPYCNHINGLDEAKPDDFCSLGERKK